MIRPKIAHITTVDGSLRSLLLNQLCCLRDAGYEVVGISTPGPDVPILEAAGVRHIAVPMTRNLTPFADLLSLRRLCQVMRREAFTLVHTHNPKPGLLGQLAARMAGVPIVVNTVHGFYFHEHMRALARRFYIAVEKIAARCSDAILSQNLEDIQTALGEGICGPEKIKHLGNGIDLSLFDPRRIRNEASRRRREELDIPAGARVVGFVGRLAARRKGFLHFLKAAARIVQRIPLVRFLVVGGTDHGKPDAVGPEAARDFGIWDHCRFLGNRTNGELPGLYSLMDVMVLPSLFEGIPRVIMEASAMGVPVVASDVKGNREAVENGRTGLLVPFGDVTALAGAIEQILADPDQARRLGAEGRRVALERYDERRVFEKVKAEYASLLIKNGFALPKAAAWEMALSPQRVPRNVQPAVCASERMALGGRLSASGVSPSGVSPSSFATTEGGVPS